MGGILDLMAGMQSQFQKQGGNVMPNEELELGGLYQKPHDPRMYFESKVREAYDLGIPPPTSPDPMHMWQYEIRSNIYKERMIRGTWPGNAYSI